MVLLPLALVGVLYGVGRMRLRRRQATAVEGRRVALFVGGYATLLITLVSPLHALGEDVFSVHMVQHILLTLVAPPLLLASQAMPVLLWGLGRAERQGVATLLRERGPGRRVLRWLTVPVVAWGLFIVTQWLWHLPTMYDLALRNPVFHYAEHLSFFGAAMLFWWPVIGAAPLPSPLTYPARILYTFLAWLPNSVLGAGITLSSTVLYAHYAARQLQTGIDALDDQRLAGLIMWIPGDLLFFTILFALFVRYMRHEEREEARIDRELDALEAQERRN